MNRLFRWLCVVGFLSVGLAGVCPAQPAPEAASPPGQLQLLQPQLPPGVYDVTFRVLVDRREQTVTPLATLTVGSPEFPKIIYRPVVPLHFAAGGVAQDFQVKFDNFKTQDVTAAVALAAAPAGAPKLSVERITMARSTNVSVATVWPGKRLYHPREAAKGLMVLFNGRSEPQRVTLQCRLESDLHHERPLLKQMLTLAPGERREVAVDWNTGPEEYGFALVATLADERGARLSEGREYFSVADNLWQVGITETSRGCWPPFGPGPNESLPVSQIKQWEEQLAAELAKPFAPVYWGYGNYDEYYAWSYNEFFCLTPDLDYWYSGVGNYTMGKRHLQLAIEWLHRRGIRAISYINPSSWGYGADKVYRQHPEWFAYQKSGQLISPAYYEKKLELGARTGPVSPWKLQLSQYALTLAPNIATLAPIDAQIAEIVKARQIFGWDGIRFDNGLYSANGYDFWGHKIDGNDPKKKDELEVRAWKHMRDTVWQRLGRDFAIGDNDDHELGWQHQAAWDESCRQGQLLMEEIPRSCWSPLDKRNRWEDYLKFYHNSGEAVRALGGHHLIIGLDNQYPVDHLYLNIFTYAGRSHPYGNYHSDDLPLGNYAQFMTRYSALLWDVERVKALPDPEKKVAVQGPQPIWWKEYATVRQAPDGKRQYLIHLVNPPARERIYSDPTNQVPAPQHNVRVSLRLAKGEKITRAWLLSAEPVTHAEPLALTSEEAGVVLVTVPQLHFWSMVVFE